jgi:hypothetical protein
MIGASPARLARRWVSRLTQRLRRPLSAVLTAPAQTLCQSGSAKISRLRCLSQQAVVQDVAAKVLCDNLQALTTLRAHDNADLPESVRINRAYVHTALKPLLPALLLGKKVAKMVRNVLQLVGKHTYVHRENLSKPRKPGPKPHKYNTQKHC